MLVFGDDHVMRYTGAYDVARGEKPRGG